MAYSIQVTGMEELLNKMDKLPEIADKVAAEALYEGAGVVADQVSRAVRGIATEPFRYAFGGRTRKPSPEEKAIMQGAAKGISKFRRDGASINTSVGIQKAGYAVLDGQTKPIPLIANAINSGTSFMKKQPFLRKAFSQSKSKATAAIEAGIQKRMKEFDIS